MSSEYSVVKYSTTVHKGILLVARKWWEREAASQLNLESEKSGSMILKFGNSVGQRRCWSASLCPSNQGWAILAWCMSELSSCKSASLLGYDIGCTWLRKRSMQSLAVIRPFIVRNYRTSRIAVYFCPNHNRSASIFHSWYHAFTIIGFLGRSRNINPSLCCGINVKEKFRKI